MEQEQLHKQSMRQAHTFCGLGEEGWRLMERRAATASPRLLFVALPKLEALLEGLVGTATAPPGVPLLAFLLRAATRSFVAPWPRMPIRAWCPTPQQHTLSAMQTGREC